MHFSRVAARAARCRASGHLDFQAIPDASAGIAEKTFGGRFERCRVWRARRRRQVLTHTHRWLLAQTEGGIVTSLLNC